jgi:hypothetical protein
MYKLKVPLEEVKFVGNEPTWTDVPEDKYQSELGKALNWYSYMGDRKSSRGFLQDYFKENGTKDQLQVLASIPDKFLPSTYANMARMSMRGFPLTEEHKAKIWLKVQEEALRRADTSDDTDDASVPSAPKTPSVPLAIDVVKSLVDDEIFALLNDEEPKTIASLLVDFRVLNNHHSACAKKVQEIRAEFVELQENRKRKESELTDWELQLIEGYAHIPTRTLNKVVKLLDSYVDDLTKAQIKSQVGKVRKKRPTDKKKMVRGLKFLPKDDTLGITSEDPTTLINCSEVWAYDTKTRKLSHYASQYAGGISVKGASLIGYDEKMSTSKTMRKPEEQIPEFAKKKRKSDLTSWYKDVKTKSSGVRPRLTATTVIIKVN